MATEVEKKLDLWSLILDSVTIDPMLLAEALDAESLRSGQDFRTRVLMRDSFLALQKKWGEDLLRSRLSPTSSTRLDALIIEDLGDKGFLSLENRLMEPTKPATIESFLRELGLSVHQPCRLTIGGSCALILADLLHRRTDDVDAVNEVPEPIRKDHALLERMISRYGLRLAHFQSHYLPDLWDTRLHSFGVFGQLHVFLVDPTDIALGKLFSRREKDLDDVRALLPAIDKSQLAERLQSSGAGLRSDEKFLQNAQRNWFILFGETLPA